MGCMMASGSTTTTPASCRQAPCVRARSSGTPVREVLSNAGRHRLQIWATGFRSGHKQRRPEGYDYLLSFNKHLCCALHNLSGLVPYRAQPPFPQRIGTPPLQQVQPCKHPLHRAELLYCAQCVADRLKLDQTDDRDFYAFPRIVKHVDDGFLAQVTELYRQRIPQGAWKLLQPTTLCFIA